MLPNLAMFEPLKDSIVFILSQFNGGACHETRVKLGALARSGESRQSKIKEGDWCKQNQRQLFEIKDEELLRES